MDRSKNGGDGGCISITEKLVGKLGVSSERLRLEGFTAFSSAARVRPPPKAISEAMASTNVRSCLECGKCASNCPVACIKEVYSPRDRSIDRRGRRFCLTWLSSGR